MANCIILTGGTWTPDHVAKIQRSLGPYRIASALEDAGYTTFVLDYIIHLSFEEIKQALKPHLNEETLWVGFSSTFFWADNSSFTGNPKERMYWTNLDDIDLLFTHIKNNSSAKLIYGGGKAPFSVFDDRIDYYIFGHADNSIVEVTHHIKDNQYYLPNIKKHHSLNIFTIDSNDYPEPKLDNITTYWWNKNFNILKDEGLPIELARGCIFKCKFCSYPLLGKKKGTYLRDSSKIKDEMIMMWETHGTTSYYFTDDTFNDDNDKIEDLHKVFCSLPFKPKFSAYLRVDLINKFPHQADLLSEMGLIGTYFGLETLQPQSARAIGKGLAPNKVKDRLYWLSDKWKDKVNIGAGFILGLPYDTHSYFNELLSWCMEYDNPIQNISFYPLYLFHRTGESAERLKEYTSEFSLHPEIYGYEFNKNNIEWELPSQNLSFKECELISNKFNSLIQPKNKVAEFQMITNLNTGVCLEDLYNLTQFEIYDKYDMTILNRNRLNEYKQLVGVNNG